MSGEASTIHNPRRITARAWRALSACGIVLFVCVFCLHRLAKAHVVTAGQNWYSALIWQYSLFAAQLLFTPLFVRCLVVIASGDPRAISPFERKLLRVVDVASVVMLTATIGAFITHSLRASAQ